jgi:hypothetical protein
VREFDIRIEAFKKEGVLRLLRREERDDALARLKNRELIRSIRSFPEGFTLVWAKTRLNGSTVVIATLLGAGEELKFDIHWPLDSDLWRARSFKAMFRRVLERMVLLWMREALGKVPRGTRREVREFAGTLLRPLPLARVEGGPREGRRNGRRIHRDGTAGDLPFRWC